MALARLRAGWGSVALAGSGGISLSNRAERAQVIPLAGGGGGGFAGGGSPGRGLDAYRSAPIQAVSRPIVVAQAGPGRMLR
jgi:hypothetical protein